MQSTGSLSFSSAHIGPSVIQGGMGIGVSSWTLARAVALRGQLGVVSGTAIDSLFSRRLQDGDVGGHMRRAMAAFPLPHVVEKVLKQQLQDGGRPEGKAYRPLSMWLQKVSSFREQITMLAAFVEVHLAKEGHEGPVGINLLTKVQLPNLATLYGAMLASVDYVIMGAGIPREVPGVLDAFAEGKAALLKFDVEGLARGETEFITFDPALHFDGAPPPLRRPDFLPVIAAHSLATVLARKANGRVDGFIVEGPTAGGHNAPPRGASELNARGEPVYGERDVVDLAVMRELGLPFWLAGGTGSPEKLEQARTEGAAGIQVGTLFAFSNESGLDPELKRQVLARVKAGDVDVVTDALASPTGFPFKVVDVEGTNSKRELFEQRKRVCDLGYLRNAYKRSDGRIGYRCAAEPVAAYVEKGGAVEDTIGRKCLCNGLMANVSHAQVREDGPERALLTSGDDLARLREFAHAGEYSADDVIDYLLG